MFVAQYRCQFVDITLSLLKYNVTVGDHSWMCWIDIWTIYSCYFHDGVNLFSWWCSLMKYYISCDPFHEGDSHEIHFMMVTLTKAVHEGDISRNTTKSCHENIDANLATMLFSRGWLPWISHHKNNPWW
jgi:hypothetical protein